MRRIFGTLGAGARRAVAVLLIVSALGVGSPGDAQVATWRDWATVEVGDTRTWVSDGEAFFERVVSRTTRGGSIAAWRGCPRPTPAFSFAEDAQPIRMVTLDEAGLVRSVDTRLPTGRRHRVVFSLQDCAPGGACLFTAHSRLVDPDGRVERARGVMRVVETSNGGVTERVATTVERGTVVMTRQTIHMTSTGALDRVEMRFFPPRFDGAAAPETEIEPVVMRPFDPAADAALCAQAGE